MGYSTFTKKEQSAIHNAVIVSTLIPEVFVKSL